MHRVSVDMELKRRPSGGGRVRGYSREVVACFDELCMHLHHVSGQEHLHFACVAEYGAD
jgi:hypothetical protein